MEEQNSKTINAFDSLFTTNRIQMLKILLPRLAPEQQSGFAVYIKLLELQYTLSLLRKPPGTRLMGNGKQLSADFFQGDNTDTLELLDEMLPFSGPKERARIENISCSPRARAGTILWICSPVCRTRDSPPSSRCSEAVKQSKSRPLET